MGLIIYNLLDRLSATIPLSEKLEKALIDPRAWESCILASGKWSVQDQNDLVSMLDDFKKYLSVCSARENRLYMIVIPSIVSSIDDHYIM